MMVYKANISYGIFISFGLALLINNDCAFVNGRLFSSIVDNDEPLTPKSNLRQLATVTTIKKKSRSKHKSNSEHKNSSKKKSEKKSKNDKKEDKDKKDKEKEDKENDSSNSGDDGNDDGDSGDASDSNDNGSSSTDTKNDTSNDDSGSEKCDDSSNDSKSSRNLETSTTMKKKSKSKHKNSSKKKSKENKKKDKKKDSSDGDDASENDSDNGNNNSDDNSSKANDDSDDSNANSSDTSKSTKCGKGNSDSDKGNSDSSKVLVFEHSVVSLNLGVSSGGDSSDENNGIHSMPNIDYMFRGYDIMYGDPISTTNFMDPGYKQPIFGVHSMKDYDRTADMKYLKPKAINILKMQSCDLSKKISVQTSSQDVLNSMSQKVSAGVSGGYGPVSAGFTASKGYQKSSHNINKNGLTAMTVDASCGVYKATTSKYIPPKFSGEFENALKTLPVLYNEDKLYAFVQSYGTHYLTEASMGSVYGEISYSAMKSDMSDSQKKSELSGSVTAGGFGVDATASASENSTNATKKASSGKDANTEIYSRGAKPPKHGNIDDWMDQSLSNPVPYEIKIERIDSMKLPIHATAKKHLTHFINNYCDILVKKKVLKTCKVPNAPNGVFYGDSMYLLNQYYAKKSFLQLGTLNVDNVHLFIIADEDPSVNSRWSMQNSHYNSSGLPVKYGDNIYLEIFEVNNDYLLRNATYSGNGFPVISDTQSTASTQYTILPSKKSASKEGDQVSRFDKIYLVDQTTEKGNAYLQTSPTGAGIGFNVNESPNPYFAVGSATWQIVPNYVPKKLKYGVSKIKLVSERCILLSSQKIAALQSERTNNDEIDFSNLSGDFGSWDISSAASGSKKGESVKYGDVILIQSVKNDAALGEKWVILPSTGNVQRTTSGWYSEASMGDDVSIYDQIVLQDDSSKKLFVLDDDSIITFNAKGYKYGSGSMKVKSDAFDAKWSILPHSETSYIVTLPPSKRPTSWW